MRINDPPQLLPIPQGVQPLPKGAVKLPLSPGLPAYSIPTITVNGKVVQRGYLGDKPLEIKEVGLLKKASNYISAKAIHIANGSPKCTDEQVEERYAICKACPSDAYVKLTKTSGKCKKCGCGIAGIVSETGDSKLRWADSACPLKHWLSLYKPKSDT